MQIILFLICNRVYGLVLYLYFYKNIFELNFVMLTSDLRMLFFNDSILVSKSGPFGSFGSFYNKSQKNKSIYSYVILYYIVH